MTFIELTNVLRAPPGDWKSQQRAAQSRPSPTRFAKKEPAQAGFAFFVAAVSTASRARYPAPPNEFGAQGLRPVVPLQGRCLHQSLALPLVRADHSSAQADDRPQAHKRDFNRRPGYAGTSASTRSGLPEPFSIFSGEAMTTAPVAGS